MWTENWFKSVFMASMLLVAVLVKGTFAWGQSTVNPENDMTGKVEYSEIAATLARGLAGSKAEAQDSALKLAQMGRRAVPILAAVIKKSKTGQERYFAALALSRIKHPSAGKVLLPFLKDPKADRNLRVMAIQSVGMDALGDSIEEVKVLAADQEDGELRSLALRALSVMPNAWKTCESLFVKGLSDDRDDIRKLSAKVCYQVATRKIYYYTGEARLIELAEKDHVIGVRCNAMAALARMKSRMSVPMLVRLLGNDQTPVPVSRQALNAFQVGTGVPVRNAKAVAKWWKDHGEKQFKNAKLLQPKGKKVADKKAEDRPAARKKMPDDKPKKKRYGGVTIGE